MITMNSIEDYKNLVELLRQALIYYSKPEQYEEIPQPDSKNLFPILIDRGYQARFALNKIEELEAAYEKIREEYIKAIENQEISLEPILKTIESIKKSNESNN